MRRGPSARRYVVRTGSALSVDVPKFLEEATASSSRRPDWTVEFSATVLPEDVVFTELFDHLKVLNGGRKLGKVALLHESDTPFGQLESSELGRGLVQEYGILQMEFPFHISQVASPTTRTSRRALPDSRPLRGPAAS